MFDVNIRKLMEAGAHFGHQTRRWNPKMKPFIFGARNGVHIIDLDQTINSVKKAYDFIVETVAHGQQVLFVGTKRQAQQIIQEAAARCDMPYVVFRWLGGTLTNFHTIRSSLERLERLEQTVAKEAKEEKPTYTKKELADFNKQIGKLKKNLSGIVNMKKLPGAVFVIDPKVERIAVAEARREVIPIVGVVDTNCDPENINYVVPGNDDALKAIELFTNVIADACIEGKRRFEERIQKEGRDKAAAAAESGKDKPSVPTFINPRIASSINRVTVVDKMMDLDETALTPGDDKEP
jgi:small subunit ribosomal protein S2